VLGFVEGLFQGHCFTTCALPSSESNDDYVHATHSFEGQWNKFVAKLKYSEFVEELRRQKLPN
jgi:hypothetical protein